MALSDPVSDVSTTLPSVRQVLLVPFRPRTYGAVLYLALAFPLGIGYFVGTVVGLSLGISLSVLLIGLPILAATGGGVVLVAAAERVVARRLLGADIPAPSWGLSEASRLRDQVLTVLTNPVLWGSLIFVLSKLAIGVAAFTVIVVVLSVGLSLLGAPLYYDTPGTSVGIFLPEPIQRELSLVVPWERFEVGISFIVRLTSWEVSTLPGALLLSVLGAFVLLLGMNILTAGGWICARWAELTLSPGKTER
jgi:hypothetical protein